MRSKILALIAALVAVIAPAATASAATDPVCRDVTIPVALAPLLPRTEHVHAVYCTPAHPRALQLLIHGMTYNGRYWDFPDPDDGTDRYSYTHTATSAGYATLAIDRIGTGQSSRPLGALVTITSNAYVIHQIVQALHHGTITGHPEPTIALVGHSYGSWVTWYEASDWHDVDAVILTGISHRVPVTAYLNVLPKILQPAMADPRFVGKIVDPTYLTTVPGQRYAAFNAPAYETPAVQAEDERTKDTVTAAEVAVFPLILTRRLDIRVPVLLVNGTLDSLFCGPAYGGADCDTAPALVAQEAPLLGAQVPCVDGYVLPAAGHDLNLMRNARDWFGAATSWLTARLSGSGCMAPWR